MKKEKIKFPLGRKIAFMAIALALCLSIQMIVFNYLNYKEEMFEHFEHDGQKICASVAARLDPDLIAHYLETCEKDETYNKTYTGICSTQRSTGVEYIYIFKPDAGGVTYFMDTDPTENSFPLGYHGAYDKGGFRDNSEKMLRGEEIKPIISDGEYGWLMTVLMPVMDSQGQLAAYVAVDIDMDEIREDLQSFANRMFLLMAIFTAFAALLDYYITKRTLADPIIKLAEAASQLVEEEQSGANNGTAIFEKLTIRSHDELGALYRSLTHMERDMNAYIRDLLSVTAEKERIGTELSIAAQIQANMLPRVFPPFPERHDFDIYAIMTPAREVGGDFYDFFLIDDDHLGLVMADVSGKGVPAALFMVNAKTLIKNRAMMGGGPAEILRYVNEQLCQGNEAELFVTVWLAIVELSTGKGLAANAGHEHPAICRANGKYELVVYRHSPPVAVMEEIHFREHCFELHPGDCLFVYTDGVTEAADENNQLFGTDRMLAGLNIRPNADPQTLLQNVKLEIDAFVGGTPQFDDITMMCLQFTGSEAKKMQELTIEAKIENLDEVLAFVDERLEEIGCSMKTQMQIDVAVEEVFVNIASYAYTPGIGSATVRIESSQDPAAVTITFVDRGIPYNPLLKEDPDVTLSAEERAIGGLGIYMVKKAVDDISYVYRDGQNILSISKTI